MAPRYGFEGAGGVIITRVTPLGPSSRRGIGPGLKLLEIDGAPVNAPQDVNDLLSGVDSGEVVSLLLGYPGGQVRIVNVRAGG